MANFLNLTPDQQNKVVMNARGWYNDHKTYVDSIVDINTRAITPSMEDCLTGPQVWKAEHWAWFIDSNL
jgi:hypothetical protein